MNRKLDQKIYDDVIANTQNRAVISSELIRKWRQDVKEVVDAHLDDFAQLRDEFDDFLIEAAPKIMVRRSSAAQTIPHDDYTKVLAQSTFLNTTDGRITYNNGDFVIGEGVSKIRIYAKVRWRGDTSDGVRYVRFELNGNVTHFLAEELSTPATTSLNVPGGDSNCTQNIVGIMPVEEGDIVSLVARQNSGNSIGLLNSGVNIGIEVIE